MKNPKRKHRKKLPPRAKMGPRNRRVSCQGCSRSYEVLSHSRPVYCVFCGHKEIKIETITGNASFVPMLSTFLMGGILALASRMYPSILDGTVLSVPVVCPPTVKTIPANPAKEELPE
jgi:ribosomal protein S27E